MDALTFFAMCADIQARSGKPFTVGQARAESQFSRQYIHKHINSLIARGYIRKISHGKYIINDTKWILSIGFCTLTPMDIYEYQSVRQISQF